ncbi:MAG: DUF2508 family protein [Alicyclobacillus sp.]|nr:DUF2508 family protein [Alicyclobacillus sp.]
MLSAKRREEIREDMQHARLRIEIEQAKKDVAIARRRWEDAEPPFVDAALYALRACEERLNVLLAEAKREAIRYEHSA